MNIILTISGVPLHELRPVLVRAGIDEKPRSSRYGWDGSILFLGDERVGLIEPGGRVGIEMHAKIDLAHFDEAATLALLAATR